MPSRGRRARPARRRSPPARDRATDATAWWVGHPKVAFSAGGHRSSNEMNSGTSRVDANDPGEARAFGHLVDRVRQGLHPATLPAAS